MAKGFKEPRVKISAPEMQFISKETVEKVEQEERAAGGSGIEPSFTGREKPPAGFKYNPKFIETRSKRVQLVVQPSVYEKLKARADAAGVSFNEYCHAIFEEVVRED